MNSSRRALCVFCASSVSIDPKYFELAAQLGAELAKRSIDVITGGGRVSLMGELARAAREHGGTTVGVIPERLMQLEVADEDAHELVVTTDMRDRKGTMDARADGFLALPGGIGTIEELVEAWVGRSLGMHRKPVVVLDPWDDFVDLRVMTDKLVARGFVKPSAASDLVWTATLDDALDAIAAGWDRGEGRDS